MASRAIDNPDYSEAGPSRQASRNGQSSRGGPGSSRSQLIDVDEPETKFLNGLKRLKTGATTRDKPQDGFKMDVHKKGKTGSPFDPGRDTSKVRSPSTRFHDPSSRASRGEAASVQHGRRSLSPLKLDTAHRLVKDMFAVNGSRKPLRRPHQQAVSPEKHVPSPQGQPYVEIDDRPSPPKRSHQIVQERREREMRANMAIDPDQHSVRHVQTLTDHFNAMEPSVQEHFHAKQYNDAPPITPQNRRQHGKNIRRSSGHEDIIAIDDETSPGTHDPPLQSQHPSTASPTKHARQRSGDHAKGAFGRHGPSSAGLSRDRRPEGRQHSGSASPNKQRYVAKVVDPELFKPPAERQNASQVQSEPEEEVEDAKNFSYLSLGHSNPIRDAKGKGRAEDEFEIVEEEESEWETLRGPRRYDIDIRPEPTGPKSGKPIQLKEIAVDPFQSSAIRSSRLKTEKQSLKLDQTLHADVVRAWLRGLADYKWVHLSSIHYHGNFFVLSPKTGGEHIFCRLYWKDVKQVRYTTGPDDQMLMLELNWSDDQNRDTFANMVESSQYVGHLFQSVKLYLELPRDSHEVKVMLDAIQKHADHLHVSHASLNSSNLRAIRSKLPPLEQAPLQARRSHLRNHDSGSLGGRNTASARRADAAESRIARHRSSSPERQKAEGSASGKRPNSRRDEDARQTKLAFRPRPAGEASTPTGISATRRSARISTGGQPALGESSRKSLSRGHTPKVTLSEEEKKILLFEYPLTGRVDVQITRGERLRVETGDFLNDNLLEFGLKHALAQLPQEVQDGVHVFNSFFYNRVSSKRGKPVKGEEETWPTWPAFDTVKKWTKNKSIFEKEFIVVPINEDFHWFLAIIFRPRNILRERPATPPPENNHALRSKAEQSSPLSAAPDETADNHDAIADQPNHRGQGGDHQESDEENLFSKQADTSMDELDVMDQSIDGITGVDKAAHDEHVNKTSRDMEQLSINRESHRCDGKDSEGLVEQELTDQPEAPPSVSKDPAQRDIWNDDRCYIFTFDSLGGSHKAVSTHLNRWLHYEARDKGVLAHDRPCDAVYEQAKVPTQPNFSDCGLFLVHYTQQLLSRPEEIIHFIQRGTPRGKEKEQWTQDMNQVWREKETSNLRRNWLQTIDNVTGEYNSLKDSAVKHDDKPTADKTDTNGPGKVKSAPPELTTPQVDLSQTSIEALSQLHVTHDQHDQPLRPEKSTSQTEQGIPDTSLRLRQSQSVPLSLDNDIDPNLDKDPFKQSYPQPEDILRDDDSDDGQIHERQQHYRNGVTDGQHQARTSTSRSPTKAPSVMTSMAEHFQEELMDFDNASPFGNLGSSLERRSARQVDQRRPEHSSPLAPKGQVGDREPGSMLHAVFTSTGEGFLQNGSEDEMRRDQDEAMQIGLPHVHQYRSRESSVNSHHSHHSNRFRELSHHSAISRRSRSRSRPALNFEPVIENQHDLQPIHAARFRRTPSGEPEEPVEEFRTDLRSMIPPVKQDKRTRAGVESLENTTSSEEDTTRSPMPAKSGSALRTPGNEYQLENVPTPRRPPGSDRNTYSSKKQQRAKRKISESPVGDRESRKRPDPKRSRATNTRDMVGKTRDDAISIDSSEEEA